MQWEKINKIIDEIVCILVEKLSVPLTRMALLRPKASAVLASIFSTILCFSFFKTGVGVGCFVRNKEKAKNNFTNLLMSKVLPCFGSAWSLLKLMVTES